MSNSRTIEIENIGPIEHLTIPIPVDGGVVTLRGRNGIGKSTGLDCGEAVMGRKVPLSVRDACRSGEVSGLGVTIRVGKTTRRSGELTAISLEDRLNIADLVNPGLKSEDAADARRIKALVSLTGAKADPALFPEESRPELEQCDDLVEMAGVAKRALQSLARTAEKQADTAAGKASAFRAAAGDVKADAPDEETARKAVEAAIREEADLKARYEAAAQREFAAAKAREAIEASENGYAGPSVEEAEKWYQLADEAYAEADEAFIAAKSRLDAARLAASASATALETAQNHEKTMAGWRETIEAAEQGDSPDEDELKAATVALDKARANYQAAVAAKSAKEKLAEADAAKAEARTFAADAERLRSLADSTDDVLADAIDCPALQVRAGRLITTTKRGPTFFSELSEGERWRIALDIAADQVGEGGIITVPQDAWEGLDAVNRRAVAEHAVARKVTILTAEAQRAGEPEELRAEVAMA